MKSWENSTSVFAFRFDLQDLAVSVTDMVSLAVWYLTGTQENQKVLVSVSTEMRKQH